MRLRGQQRSLVGQVEDVVVFLRGCGEAEFCRLLAVGVTAPAIVADSSGTHLMPSLCHRQHESVFVEHLKRVRRIGRNADEKACVGIAVGIGRLREQIPTTGVRPTPAATTLECHRLRARFNPLGRSVILFRVILFRVVSLAPPPLAISRIVHDHGRFPS